MSRLLPVSIVLSVLWLAGCQTAPTKPDAARETGARDRIEAGDYGYCDETGEPIGLGRLLARPTATLSLEAQQRREMKQKMFGD